MLCQHAGRLVRLLIASGEDVFPAYMRNEEKLKYAVETFQLERFPIARLQLNDRLPLSPQRRGGDSLRRLR